MQGNYVFLAALGALAQCVRGLIESPNFGMTDPSEYKFYDASEECNNSTEPCITNFKYCSLAADTTFIDKRKCQAAKDDNLTWMEDTEEAVLWIGELNGPVSVLKYQSYTLRWQNTNPEYPTTLTWRASSYDSGSTFYMYQVVPPGETEWTFYPNTMSRDMLSSNDYFDSGYSVEMSRYVDAMLHYATFWLTVGQPEDPKYANQEEYQNGKNETDRTSLFRFMSSASYEIVWSQTHARRHERDALHNKEKKWKKGVGIGVGVGVPLIAAIFFLGGSKFGKSRTMQRKKVTQPGE